MLKWLFTPFNSIHQANWEASLWFHKLDIDYYLTSTKYNEQSFSRLLSNKCLNIRGNLRHFQWSVDWQSDNFSEIKVHILCVCIMNRITCTFSKDSLCLLHGMMYPESLLALENLLSLDFHFGVKTLHVEIAVTENNHLV